MSTLRRSRTSTPNKKDRNDELALSGETLFASISPSGMLSLSYDDYRASLASSPTASISSITTIASTNTQHSVAELVSATQELINFFCKNELLVPLYKEAFGSRNIDAVRFVRNFRRLLKVYSNELKDQAEDSLHHDAARLVRFRAKIVAEAIRKKYASMPSNTKLGSEVTAIQSSSDEEDQATFREDSVDKFALVEGFLINGPAFANLKTNLERFVRLTLPSQRTTMAQPLPEERSPETKAPMLKSKSLEEQLELATFVESNWSRRVFADIQRQLARMGLAEKPLEHGKQRIRWQCSCGKRLFDDYRELEPDSLEELREFLEESSKVMKRDGSSQTRNSSPDKGLLSGLGASIRNCFNSKSTTPCQDPCLPSYNPQQVANAPTTNSTNPKMLPSTHLMLCMSASRFGVNLYQEDVSSLQADCELFPYLREAYTLRRGRIRSFFSLRTVESIDFVKFDLFTGEAVDLQHHDKYCRPAACECLPPKPLTEDPDPEYRCAPVPPPYSPPIGPNLLMHYLQHPDCISAKQTRVLRQFPKRMRGQLAALDDAVHGWGIHFREGWAWDKIWAALMVVFVLGSFVFAILWSVFQRDLQGAFGVASWWVSICTVCLGYMATRNP
ncbi:uncharacterized protein K452DRAFT_125379 [Aplosporella prunicola CBS 121167]|uniref:Uncharacterized protein n=1 Tax=Aplosporella prunicola CBS 121167 TaxID=1176127 RepID=A0A6A6BPW5_9PEZI|nr:uncharacterized protein K452DRAFT_125379 [Aplosporella prunicola CBS 121167]KAF2145778.1 hypothetical protein K452DRAFT_125379 [Aplosporella prunicola CBS 121167]